MLLVAASLGGGLPDRTAIEWRFVRANIARHVGTDAILQPCYAYDGLHQRLAIATGVAVVVLWLSQALLRRWRMG